MSDTESKWTTVDTIAYSEVLREKREAEAELTRLREQWARHMTVEHALTSDVKVQAELTRLREENRYTAKRCIDAEEERDRLHEALEKIAAWGQPNTENPVKSIARNALKETTP